MYAAARLAGRTGAEDGNRWGSRWKPEQKTATTASAILDLECPTLKTKNLKREFTVSPFHPPATDTPTGEDGIYSVPAAPSAAASIGSRRAGGGPGVDGW